MRSRVISGKIKIVVVDDEADVLTYLATVLRNEGYRVDTADNADRGWELMESEHPDLVCLDIMMPKKSGISLYTQMKDSKELRQTPVIIISGVIQSGQFDFREYVSDESVRAPEAYFEKPIEVRRFLQEVRVLTGRSQQHNSPRPS